MRPPRIYANVSDKQYHELLSALHHQWRPATRAVMVVLSANGMPATDIGTLLHYSPTTVRRWIARHEGEGVAGLPDRPRSGRPRIGSPGLGQRIAALLATPKAWTTARIWRALGRPKLSLRIVLPAHTRTGPMAAAAAGRQRRPRPRHHLCRYPRPDHRSASRVGRAGRRRNPPRPARQGAGLLDDPPHPPPDPHPRHQHPAHGLRRGQPAHRAVHHTSPSKASPKCSATSSTCSCTPTGTRRGRDLRQRRHPHQRHYPTLARRTSEATSVTRQPIQPSGQPHRTRMGRSESLDREHRPRDHARPRQTGPRLLPRPHTHPNAHHHRTMDITLAARRLRTRLMDTCFRRPNPVFIGVRGRVHRCRWARIAVPVPGGLAAPPARNESKCRSRSLVVRWDNSCGTGKAPAVVS